MLVLGMIAEEGTALAWQSTIQTAVGTILNDSKLSKIHSESDDRITVEDVILTEHLHNAQFQTHWEDVDGLTCQANLDLLSLSSGTSLISLINSTTLLTTNISAPHQSFESDESHNLQHEAKVGCRLEKHNERAVASGVDGITIDHVSHVSGSWDSVESDKTTQQPVQNQNADAFIDPKIHWHSDPTGTQPKSANVVDCHSCDDDYNVRADKLDDKDPTKSSAVLSEVSIAAGAAQFKEDVLVLTSLLGTVHLVVSIQYATVVVVDLQTAKDQSVLFVTNATNGEFPGIEDLLVPDTSSSPCTDIDRSKSVPQPDISKSNPDSSGVPDSDNGLADSGLSSDFDDPQSDSDSIEMFDSDTSTSIDSPVNTDSLALEDKTQESVQKASAGHKDHATGNGTSNSNKTSPLQHSKSDVPKISTNDVTGESPDQDVSQVQPLEVTQMVTLISTESHLLQTLEMS